MTTFSGLTTFTGLLVVNYFVDTHFLIFSRMPKKGQWVKSGEKRLVVRMYEHFKVRYW